MPDAGQPDDLDRPLPAGRLPHMNTSTAAKPCARQVWMLIWDSANSSTPVTPGPDRPGVEMPAHRRSALPPGGLAQQRVSMAMGSMETFGVDRREKRPTGANPGQMRVAPPPDDQPPNCCCCCHHPAAAAVAVIDVPQVEQGDQRHHDQAR